MIFGLLVSKTCLSILIGSNISDIPSKNGCGFNSNRKKTTFYDNSH